MRIKKITYSRGMTVNVGDFESVRVDIAAEADIGDSPYAEALAELRGLVDADIRSEVRAIRRRVDQMRAE